MEPLSDNYFKDMLQDDIDTVFFNEKEFATFYDVVFQNGMKKSMKLIIDDDLLSDLKGKSPYDEGLSLSSLFFFAKENDFEEQPAEGAFISIDGKDYKISDSNVYSDGIYEITCETII